MPYFEVGVGCSGMGWCGGGNGDWGLAGLLVHLGSNFQIEKILLGQEAPRVELISSHVFIVVLGSGILQTAALSRVS